MMSHTTRRVAYCRLQRRSEPYVRVTPDINDARGAVCARVERVLLGNLGSEGT